jgi:hypothetical protein
MMYLFNICLLLLAICNTFHVHASHVEDFDITRNRTGFIAKCKPYYKRPKKYPVSKTGAWTYPVCDGQYNFDFYVALAFVDLMNQVYEKLKVEKGIKKLNVIEFGAGCGCYSQMWRSYSQFNVMALEGNPRINELTQNSIWHMDLTVAPKSSDALLNWQSNEEIHVVICLEVMEHIPSKYQDMALLNLLRRQPDYLFLSWSDHDTGGQGHVNIRDQSYVASHLSTRYGYDHLAKATEAIRTAPSTAWYFKDTFSAFHRGANSGHLLKQLGV